MANAINWFEIPAANYERATKFYATVLGVELPQNELMGKKMSFLPMSDGGIGGAVCYGEGYKPSVDGVLPYLNGGSDLNNYLTRVEPAGGKVVTPKTKITDEIGYFAIFMDTEGNKIAFHSQK
jgi:hypothetical protein